MRKRWNPGAASCLLCRRSTLLALPFALLDALLESFDVGLGGRHGAIADIKPFGRPCAIGVAAEIGRAARNGVDFVEGQGADLVRGHGALQPFASGSEGRRVTDPMSKLYGTRFARCFTGDRARFFIVRAAIGLERCQVGGGRL